MEAELRLFFVSLESKPAYSKNTRQAYQKDITSFVDYLRGILQRPPELDDLQAGHVAAYLEYECMKGRKRSTLLRRRAALRCFYQFLSREGFIRTEFSNLSVQSLSSGISSSTPAQISPHLSNEQIELLWKKMDESHRPLARRDQAILAVLLETGLSVSALIALDLSDLDLRARKLHTEDDCWIPLKHSSDALDAYLFEGRPELNAAPDEPALFISQTGARMSRQSVWQLLRHWGRAAHLPVTLSPRIIRHTAAMRLSQSGHSLAEIQRSLGHTNPLSTQALLHRLKAKDRNP